jgi:hypothetical protein
MSSPIRRVPTVASIKPLKGAITVNPLTSGIMVKPITGAIIVKTCIHIGDLPVYRSKISNDEITRATRSDLLILLHLNY